MSLLVQSPPPDTSGYYRAAYIVAAVLYTAYVLSLWWRARRARRLNQ